MPGFNYKIAEDPTHTLCRKVVCPRLLQKNCTFNVVVSETQGLTDLTFESSHWEDTDDDKLLETNAI